MTLTLGILFSCWALGAFFLVCLVYQLVHRHWFLALFSYAMVGFFSLALPFKIGLPATSKLGMLFLSLAWPVWWPQKLLGYSILSWMPPEFWTWMFNF